ncbi:MAG: hypothetical protein KGY46_02275 [Anaerolineales bacterium]|nr:hypothetical protein [Anaerolineales bacterium]
MALGKDGILSILSAALILGISGCQVMVPQGSQGTQTPEAIQPSTPEAAAEIGGQGDLLRQWASEAEASSEYTTEEWGAAQATGPPDSPGCGDYQFAWASAASDSIATLTLQYVTAVYPTEITIIESFNPDQVVKVEVQTLEGDFQVVYESEPTQVDRPCPYSLTVPVTEFGELVDGLRITVDQSQLGLGWNEIDAVQLIGRTGE